MKTDGGWNSAVAILPTSHDVVVLNSFAILVLGRDGSGVLDRAKLSFTKHSALFAVSDTRVLAADEHGVYEVTLPGLARRALYDSEVGLEASAACATRIVVAEESAFEAKGKVVVLDATGAPISEHPFAGHAESIALSADGSTYAIQYGAENTEPREARTEIYETATHRLESTVRGDLLQAAALSADGRVLASYALPSKVFFTDTSTGRELRRYQAEGWATTIAFAGEVAASGSARGVYVYPPKRGDARRISDDDNDAYEGVAITADESMVCSGTRQGAVACFGDATPPPSKYPARPGAATEKDR